MHYLLCKTKVDNFDTWMSVFSAHRAAHAEAEPELLNIFRDSIDPNLVMVFMRAADPDKAKAFTSGKPASDGAEDSGVIGDPEIWHLSD